MACSSRVFMRRRQTALSVSCPRLVFVRIVREIVSGDCLLSGFSVRCLSVRILSSRILSVSILSASLVRSLSVRPDKDEVRNFTVLVRRRLVFMTMLQTSASPVRVLSVSRFGPNFPKNPVRYLSAAWIMSGFSVRSLSVQTLSRLNFEHTQLQTLLYNLYSWNWK